MMKKMFWIGPKNSSNQMKNKMKFKCTPTLNLKYYFVVLIFSFSSISFAKTDLYPTAIMKHETQWLVRLLEQEHYNKVKVGDLNTTDFINNFLKKLDKQKLYFTKGEIEEFHKRYQTTVIPHLTNGNLLPGFEMYNLYQQKAISRLNWVLSELNNEPELFNDDNFTNNRNESPWVENEDQLNEIWRDLISSEYIRDILQQLDENVTNIQENSNLLPEYISSARKSISKSYSKWIENIREFEALIKNNETTVSRIENDDKKRISLLKSEIEKLKIDIQNEKRGYPKNWSDTYKNFQKLIKEENLNRNKYRRAMDNSYDEMSTLLNILLSKNEFYKFRDEFKKFSKILETSEPKSLSIEIKIFSKKLSRLPDNSKITSKLSRVSRNLKKKKVNYKKVVKDFNISFEEYEKKYSDLKKIDNKVIDALTVFLNSTKFTIGLRQQQKIPRDIALFLAGCKSDHRDLSLYF